MAPSVLHDYGWHLMVPFDYGKNPNCENEPGKLVKFGNTVCRVVVSCGRPYQRAKTEAYWSTDVVGIQRPRGVDPESVSSGPPGVSVGK